MNSVLGAEQLCGREVMQMTLEQYIELFEKPNFKVEVDTAELLSLFKELRDARELIKRQAQYIEVYIDTGR